MRKISEEENFKRLLDGKNTAEKSWEALLYDLENMEQVSLDRIAYCMEQCNRWDWELGNARYKQAMREDLKESL